MNRSRMMVLSIALLMALALSGFFWVKARYGPAPQSITYICTDPRCGAVFTVQLTPEQANDPAQWPEEIPCPECGGVARWAVPCVSCNALVPLPKGDLLKARCPKCGKPLFGPLGGLMPRTPIYRNNSRNGNKGEAE
jgi:DNA-directed RNA polymerase subunit RPC12/RpoP